MLSVRFKEILLISERSENVQGILCEIQEEKVHLIAIRYV